MVKGNPKRLIKTGIETAPTPQELARVVDEEQTIQGSEPPADLPVPSGQGQIESKLPEQRLLDEDYVQEIREYYHEIFSGEEKIKELLRKSGFKPLSPWVQEAKKLLEKYNLIEDCLQYTLETLSESEKYKGRKEDLENAIIGREFEKIPEIGEEIAKVIIFYYGEVLETRLERAKKESNKEIIRVELGKVEEFLKKYEALGNEGKSLKTEEKPWQKFEEAIKDPKEKELFKKIREAVSESLKEAINRIKNLTDSQLLLLEIERAELEKGCSELLKKEKIEEIIKECFDAFKEKYPVQYWTASSLIEDWADSFAQSEFTIYGNEPLKNAYLRAYQFERGVSKLKHRELGKTPEELERAFPKAVDGTATVRKDPEKESGKRIEEIFDREGRMEIINKAIEAISSIHEKLIKDSKEWGGYKDLPDEERIQSVTIDTKANILNIYDELLVKRMGFPKHDRFKRAFYKYAVSRIEKS